MKLLIYTCLLLLCGCGSGGVKLYPVTGTVKVDAEPVEGLIVAFAPADGGMSGAGSTDALGQYTITSAQGRGLPAGNYNVSIQQAAPVVNTAAADSELQSSSNSAAYAEQASGNPSQYKAAEKAKKSQKQLPEKYNAKSTLKEIVAKTTNTIDFNLSWK